MASRACRLTAWATSEGTASSSRAAAKAANRCVALPEPSCVRRVTGPGRISFGGRRIELRQPVRIARLTAHPGDHRREELNGQRVVRRVEAALIVELAEL